MADNFSRCVDVVLDLEGGFTETDDGAVAWGVSLPLLQAWLGRPVIKQELVTLTREDAKPIWKKLAWDCGHLDHMPAGVDLVLLDWIGCSGMGPVVAALQTLTGRTDHHPVIGPMLLQGAAAFDPGELINALTHARGTTERSLHIAEAAHGMAPVPA
jgi:lysozyme family protein